MARVQPTPVASRALELPKLTPPESQRAAVLPGAARRARSPRPSRRASSPGRSLSMAARLRRSNVAQTNLQLLQEDANGNEPPRKLRRARLSHLDWLLGTSSGQLTMMMVCGVCIIIFGSLGMTGVCHLLELSDPGCGTFDLWFAYTMFIDIGTQTGLDITYPWEMKYCSVLISLFGFMWSLTFLGIIVDRMRNLLDYWRRDRQRIVLTGHTLVLGWSEKSSFLLSEMVYQAETKKHGRTIVIMSERDELYIHQEIRRQLKQFLKSKSCWRRLMIYWSIRVIPRQGFIDDVEDLMRVSASSAREVVVLGSGDSRKADLAALRSVLALAALPDELSGQVVVEVQQPEFVLVLRGLLPGLESIVARNTVNRVLCLLAARPKAGAIFMRLLTYTAGEQLYAVRAPLLTGQTFGEACRSFQRAMCLGLKTAKGKFMLAPADSHLLQRGDKLILMAYSEQDVVGRGAGKAHANLDQAPSASATAPAELFSAAFDGAVQAASSAAVMTTGAVRTTVRSFIRHSNFSAHSDASCPEPVLDDEDTMQAKATEEKAARIQIYAVIGWCCDMADVLHQLAQLVPSGSEVHILSDVDMEEREKQLSVQNLTTIVIKHYIGERCSVAHLANLPLRDATAILVLSEGKRQRLLGGLPAGGDDAMISDSVCLACMQLVTASLQSLDLGGNVPQIICEVNDPCTDRVLARNQVLRNRATFLRSGALEMGLFNIAATDATAFNALVQLLSQTMCSSGGGLHVVPISNLVSGLPETLNESSNLSSHRLSFWDLHEKLRDRDGSLLLGWLREDKCYLPVLDRNTRLSWCREDQLVVLYPGIQDPGQ